MKHGITTWYTRREMSWCRAKDATNLDTSRRLSVFILSICSYCCHKKNVIVLLSPLAKFVQRTCSNRSAGSRREHFMNSSAVSSPVICLKSFVMVSQTRKNDEGNMD